MESNQSSRLNPRLQFVHGQWEANGVDRVSAKVSSTFLTAILASAVDAVALEHRVAAEVRGFQKRGSDGFQKCGRVPRTRGKTC